MPRAESKQRHSCANVHAANEAADTAPCPGLKAAARSCGRTATGPPSAKQPNRTAALGSGAPTSARGRRPPPSLAHHKADGITFAYGRATWRTGAVFAAASDPSAPPRPRTAQPPGAPRRPCNADRPRPGSPPPGPAPRSPSPAPAAPAAGSARQPGTARRGRRPCGQRRGAPRPPQQAAGPSRSRPSAGRGHAPHPVLSLRGPSPALGLPRDPRTAASRSSPRLAPRDRRSPTGRGGTGAAAQAQVRLRQPGPSLWRRGSAPPAAVAVATPAPGGRAPAPRAGSGLRVHRWGSACGGQRVRAPMHGRHGHLRVHIRAVRTFGAARASTPPGSCSRTAVRARARLGSAPRVHRRVRTAAPRCLLREHVQAGAGRAPPCARHAHEVLGRIDKDPFQPHRLCDGTEQPRPSGATAARRAVPQHGAAGAVLAQQCCAL